MVLDSIWDKFIFTLSYKVLDFVMLQMFILTFLGVALQF